MPYLNHFDLVSCLLCHDYSFEGLNAWFLLFPHFVLISHLIAVSFFSFPPIKFLDALFEHEIFFHKQVTALAKPQQIVEKADPVATEAAKKVSDAAPAVSPPRVDFATDLFDLLSMDGPTENGSEAAANDDNSWAGFQCMFYLFGQSLHSMTFYV